MDRSRVGIVIPALNESATISKVVNEAASYGMPIVVNDGSTDCTAELAEIAGAVVVSHKHNLGYDAALNSGFKRASDLGHEIIITLDADGQHLPELIAKFVEILEGNVDVVMGIRSQRQRLAEHFFAWYTNLRYGIKDPLCGMKGYKACLYRKLGHFDSYGSVGTELMLFAAMNQYRLEQIPLAVRARSGQPRFGSIIKGNLKIFSALIVAIWKSR